MKKLRTFLAMAAVAATAALTSGCEIVGPPGPQGPPGESGYMNNISFDITVDRDHWFWNEDMGSFVYTVYGIDELTANAIENGFYHMYLYKMDGDELVRETLPYIEYGEDNNRLWQRSFACDYGPYAITFYIRNSDFYDREPETLNFRFVGIW